jgi:hypothetical protein
MTITEDYVIECGQENDIICHPRPQWLGNTNGGRWVVRAGQIIRVWVLGFHGCCVLACAEEGREEGAAAAHVAHTFYTVVDCYG